MILSATWAVRPSNPPKDTPAAVCYFCGAEITPDDRVRQFHELMVHQTCYQRDVSR